MSQTEQNYAQIEKELRAIVFACEKFDQYIFGRSDVVVESDHPPLETIFKQLILTSPKRLQRMRLRLQNYNIQVVYKRGTTMFLADTLSRAYLEDEPERTTPRNDVRSIKERVFALEGMNASPVQLLYGRRTRTRLPVTKSLLVPQVISDVSEMIKVRKQKQKFYYDRHSHELPALHDGDTVRMRLPGENEWSLGPSFLSGGC